MSEVPRMSRLNGVRTLRLQLTIDATTVGLGIYGANKAEVACSMIRHWSWENQDKLRANGISLAPVQPVPDR